VAERRVRRLLGERPLVGADVRLGNDSDEPITLLRHEHAIELVLSHQLARVVEVLIRPRRDKLSGRDVIDAARGGVTPLRNDSGDHVAIGDHPHYPVPLDDRKRSLLLLNHPLRGVHDTGARLHGDDVRDHPISDLLSHRSSLLANFPCPTRGCLEQTSRARLRALGAGRTPVEEATAVRHACDFELALCDESIEQCPQRGRAQLIPENPQVLLVPTVELGDADPARRTFDRERLLIGGEIVDTGVEHARELFPLVGWNVVEGGYEA
jgi:hypothetical protein